MPRKLSMNAYRNIDGVRYECYTSNPADFDSAKIELKQAGLKFRMINTIAGPELFSEVKPVDNHSDKLFYRLGAQIVSAETEI